MRNKAVGTFHMKVSSLPPYNQMPSLCGWKSVPLERSQRTELRSEERLHL